MSWALRCLSKQFLLLPSMLSRHSGRVSPHTSKLLMAAIATATVVAGSQDDELQYKARMVGNGFANSAMRSAVLANQRANWFYDQLRKKECVTPTENTAGHILFRGEFCFDEDPEMHARHLLESGRFAPIFALRDLPSGGQVNLTPTMGNPILVEDIDVPVNWSAGGVSLTASLEDAMRYAGDDGVIVLAAPKKYIAMADHAYHTNSSEYEFVSSSIEAAEIVAVIVVKGGEMTNAYLNESTLHSAKRLTGDIELDHLLTDVAKSPTVNKILSPLKKVVDPALSLKADYDAREAEDIYALYARTIHNFRTQYREERQSFFGFFGGSKVIGAEEKFLRDKLPTLNTILDKPAYRDQYDADKIVNLQHQLIHEFGLSTQCVNEMLGDSSSLDLSPRS